MAFCLLVICSMLGACAPTDGAPRRGTAGAQGGVRSGLPLASPSSGTERQELPRFDPILESAPSAGTNSLGAEDLQNLGEVGILPHLMQTMAPGTACDFDSTLSSCQ
jgi:hypothetical protein